MDYFHNSILQMVDEAKGSFFCTVNEKDMKEIKCSLPSIREFEKFLQQQKRP